MAARFATSLSSGSSHLAWTTLCQTRISQYHLPLKRACVKGKPFKELSSTSMEKCPQEEKFTGLLHNSFAEIKWTKRWFPFTINPCHAPRKGSTFFLPCLLPYWWWLSCTKKPTGRILLPSKLTVAAVFSQNCVRELWDKTSPCFSTYLSELKHSTPARWELSFRLSFLSSSVDLWLFFPLFLGSTGRPNIRCCGGEEEKQMQIKEELCVHPQKSRQKRSDNTLKTNSWKNKQDVLKMNQMS